MCRCACVRVRKLLIIKHVTPEAPQCHQPSCTTVVPLNRDLHLHSCFPLVCKQQSLNRVCDFDLTHGDKNCWYRLSCHLPLRIYLCLCVLYVVILLTGGCVVVRFARHGGCASHGERRLILELCWGLVAAVLEPSASLPHVSPWLLPALCILSEMAWGRVVGLSRACVHVFLTSGCARVLLLFSVAARRSSWHCSNATPCRMQRRSLSQKAWT